MTTRGRAPLAKSRREVSYSAIEGRGGRPRLWAYGVRTLAKLARVHPETVRAAIRSGELPTHPERLLEIADWIRARRAATAPEEKP